MSTNLSINPGFLKWPEYIIQRLYYFWATLKIRMRIGPNRLQFSQTILLWVLYRKRLKWSLAYAEIVRKKIP